MSKLQITAQPGLAEDAL